MAKDCEESQNILNYQVKVLLNLSRLLRHYKKKIVSIWNGLIGSISSAQILTIIPFGPGSRIRNLGFFFQQK